MKRPPLRTTHSFAIMEVSQSAYDEIKAKLEEAGYDHAVWEEGDDGTLLAMNGIALALERPKPTEVTYQVTKAQAEEQVEKAKEGLALVVNGPHMGAWVPADKSQIVMPEIPSIDFSSIGTAAEVPGLPPNEKLIIYRRRQRIDEKCFVFVWED